MMRKATLPTMREAGLSFEDLDALRLIPHYRKTSFYQPQLLNKPANINWEKRTASKKPEYKKIPGLQTELGPPQNNIHSYFVNPATRLGALAGDVTFLDNPVLLGIRNKDNNYGVDFWRTERQGAGSEGGEGLIYGELPKQNFAEIPINYHTAEALRAKLNLDHFMNTYNASEEEAFDALATRFPEVHNIASQFPNVSTQDTSWQQPAQYRGTNPLLLDDIDTKVASEPMDFAMRLLKRDKIYDPNAENKGQEGVEWHPGEEGVDWDSAVSSSLHPSHDLTQRHPFDYDMHEYDHYAQKLLNLMLNRDIAHLQNNENPMTENEQFDLIDARQKLHASIPKNVHFPSIQNAVGYDKDGNKISTFGEGRPKFSEGSPRYQELIGDRPTVPIHTKGSFYGVPFNEETGFTRSEPMEIAMQLLKERVSPEAKRHKLEYDKKYESSPERVKYREELNRERRRRHIMGRGGPDMSHTKDHNIVPEDPHTNRARHFKDKGTLL